MLLLLLLLHMLIALRHKSHGQSGTMAAGLTRARTGREAGRVSFVCSGNARSRMKGGLWILGEVLGE